MTLSTHLAISGAIMAGVGDPTLAIALNIGLHPVLDALPHAEWSTFVNPRRREITKGATLTLIDLAAAAYVIWLLSHLALPTSYLVAGLLAGTWMDWLQPLVNKSWPAFTRWHVGTHSWPQPAIEPIDWDKSFTGRTPTWAKLILQIALTALAIWLIRH